MHIFLFSPQSYASLNAKSSADSILQFLVALTLYTFYIIKFHGWASLSLLIDDIKAEKLRKHEGTVEESIVCR